MIFSQFVSNQPIWRNNNSTIVNEIINNIWDGREESTVHQYCLSLRKYLAFLNENDYPSKLPFSSTTVAEYLTLQKMNDKPKSSIDTAIAAMKWIHSFIPGLNDWNNPMNDSFLQKIVSSSKRRPSGQKNQKKPISGKIINDIISQTNTDCLEELRNCLIVALSFCLLLRHNEISHLILDNFEESSDAYKILITKSKTDKFRNGSHVYLKKSTNSNSISSLFTKYLSKSGLSIGENHFLFFPLKKVKGAYFITNKILSYASYRDIVKKLISKIGLNPDDYGTHSMRSGGATALAPQTTEHELLITGRWSDPRSIRSYVEMSESSRLNISKALQDKITSSNSSVSSSDSRLASFVLSHSDN